MLLFRALVLFGMSIATAHATLISIDADNYAAWTDVSQELRGVHLSTYTNLGGTPPRFDALYAVPIASTAPGITGPMQFGHLPVSGWRNDDFRNTFQAINCMNGTADCQGYDPFYQFGVLRADFETLTDFVEIRTLMPDHAPDGGLLYAFGMDGTLLTSCRVPGGGAIDRVPGYGSLEGPPCGARIATYGCEPDEPYNCLHVYTAHIARDTADIAFVMWGGRDEDSSVALFDVFTVNAVNVPEPGTLSLLLASLLGVLGLGRKKAAAR